MIIIIVMVKCNRINNYIIIRVSNPRLTYGYFALGIPTITNISRFASSSDSQCIEE